MALCGVATLLLLACCSSRLGVSTTRLWVAALLFALSPLALGPISLNTYDAWPALLTSRRSRCCSPDGMWPRFALLGAAFAAKVYPVVLVPPAVIFVWRTARSRARVTSARGLCRAWPRLFVVPVPRACAPRPRGELSRAGGAVAAGGEPRRRAPRRRGPAGAVQRAPSCIAPGTRSRTTSSGSLPETLAVVSSIAQALAVLGGRVALLAGTRRAAAAHARLRGRGRRLPRLHALLLAAVPRLARPVRRAARAASSGR